MSGRDVIDWLRWSASAALVLGAHAAAAAIIVNYVDAVVPGTPSAAIVIDLAPMAAAPENAQPDLAPGPVQPQIDGTEVKPEEPIAEAPDKPVVAQEPVVTRPEEKPVEVAAAKVEPAEEKVETPPETKPQDQPLIEKAPEASKPEVVATVPVARASPPKPKPKKASRPMQFATAPMPAPHVDTRAAAPSIGLPAPSASRSAEGWREGIISALQRAKRYPSDAKSRNEQGATKVAFVLDRAGRVLSSRIVVSSGFAALDQEALATVQRAGLPPAPAEHPGARFNFAVPITFFIR